MAAVAALLAGCVYYNGMYNTERLVRSARKAEREGKPFEASNLWGQVIIRAESVAVRHPESKYASQATVIRGLAMSRLGQCNEAIGPLGQVSLLPPGDLSEEATLALGRCEMERGDPASADLAFTRLLESKDSYRRAEASFHHARALRMTGSYDEAAALLQGANAPRAEDELLLALAGAGRDAEADSLAGLLLANGDSTRRWDSLVVVMGRSNPAAASQLVDRLGTQAGAPPALAAKRLYEDGLRLEKVDTARAAARFAEAARTGPGTDGGERGRLRLLRLGIARSGTADDLAPAADSLRLFLSQSTIVTTEAGQLLSTVTRVRLAADSGGAGVPQGDMRLFLGAEAARDTLAAPRLAGGLFRRLVSEWPASPYAPKALLAAGRLDPTWADSANTLLAERYGDSPYLAVLRGEPAEGYRVLEDSLLEFAAALPAVRVAPPAVRRRVPEPEAPDVVRPGAATGARRRAIAPEEEDAPRGGRRLEP